MSLPKKLHPSSFILHPSKKGFSLIELLVVIAIITILITAGTVSYTKSQQKVRDAKRKSDLKTIQVALDKYYQNNGYYPKVDFGSSAFLIWCHPISPTKVTIAWGNPFTCGTLPITYLNSLPKDPIQDASGNNRYLYSAPGTQLLANTPNSYLLYAKLESTSVNDFETGCASLSDPPGYNYCVTNP